MSIRSNPEKAVHLMVKNLRETIRKVYADEYDPSVNKISKIESDLSAIADLIPVVKQWERKLMDPLTNLNRSIRNYERGSINSWLDGVEAEIVRIKNSVSELQQLSLTEKTTEYAKGAFGDKGPNDRRGLSGLEEWILVDPVMDNFQASYDNLERIEVKLCLLLLSIFPENAVIKKTPLIYWWIGEGLVKTEKEGEEVFKELLNRDLILPYFAIDNNTSSPVVNKCQLHPWIRFMLISVAKKALLIYFDSKGVPHFDMNYSRRASLVLDGGLPSVDECKNLKTIFNVNEKYIDFSAGLLVKLEKLTVLQLGCWQWEDFSKHQIRHIEVLSEAFLKDLRTQKHLKYLSFRGISRITVLPPSIRELVNLEILDLKACHNLEMLPDIKHLRKLTHLDISQCYLLESMPKGLEELTSLQVLKGFVIGNPKRKNPSRIGNLLRLVNLERLSIHIGSEAVVKDGDQEFKLEHLTKLRRLKISWGDVSEKLKKPEMKQPNFTFPASLEKLDLEGIPQEAPEWLKPNKLRNLKKLYIKGGILNSLNHEGTNSWKVEILILKYLKNLKCKLVEVKTLFPELKYVLKRRKETMTQSQGVRQSEIQEEEGGVDQDFEWCKEPMHI